MVRRKSPFFLPFDDRSISIFFRLRRNNQGKAAVAIAQPHQGMHYSSAEKFISISQHDLAASAESGK